MPRHNDSLLRSILTVAPWTLALGALALVLNVGVIVPSSEPGARLIEMLQFDREAIAAGEVWRVLTGNLVHWSAEHLWLDVGALLVVGFLFERSIGRAYPWLLFASASAVGLAILLLQRDMSLYRGLSGVCSGQFAIALIAELRRTRDWRQIALTGTAALIFVLKIGYECITGQMFFGTESLGELGTPTPLAHLAGTAGVLAGLLVLRARRSRSTRRTEPRLFAPGVPASGVSADHLG
jgi:rhomboid family GlyGly-CTERM serine protease